MSIKIIELFLDDSTSINEVLRKIQSSFMVKDTDKTNVFWIGKSNDYVNTNTILKPKEVAVLNALEKGQTYKEIADTTNLSINAVRFYIKRIYNKLEVNNSRMALMKYYEIKNNSMAGLA